MLAGIAIKEHTVTYNVHPEKMLIRHKVKLKLSLSITVLMSTCSLDTTHVDLSVACAFITTMTRSVWLFLYSE